MINVFINQQTFFFLFEIGTVPAKSIFPHFRWSRQTSQKTRVRALTFFRYYMENNINLSCGLKVVCFRNQSTRWQQHGEVSVQGVVLRYIL